jgi:hypothetical protein
MVEIECNEPLPWGELGTLLELTLKVALGWRFKRCSMVGR